MLRITLPRLVPTLLLAGPALLLVSVLVRTPAAGADDGPGGSPSSGGTASGRRPLDLPVGDLDAAASRTQDPRCLDRIVPYGSVHEGDAFFICFDRSAGTTHDAVAAVIAAEITDAIDALGEETLFTLVAFAASPTEWSPVARPATQSWREKAGEWIADRPIGGEGCLTAGLVRTIEIASRSSAAARRVIVIAAAPPSCGGVIDPAGALTAIEGANWPHLSIDTIDVGIAEGAHRPAAMLLRRIAERSGGTFAQPRW